MNSESGDDGFRRRLAELVGVEEPYAWAKRVGIPSGTFARVWGEGTVPKLPHLRRIASATGVNLDWLLLGRGLKGGSAPLSSALDPHLYGVISGEVARVYKEIGMAASAHTVGEEAAKIAAEIAASGVAGDEALPAVRVLVAQLRRRLTSELADPASRKRQG
jgi:hypothetical protein